MKAIKRAIKMTVSSSHGQETKGRTSQQLPRQSSYVKEKHDIPKAPIRQVSFSDGQSILSDTEHTATTVMDCDYDYRDYDDYQDYDDLDYDELDYNENDYNAHGHNDDNTARNFRRINAKARPPDLPESTTKPLPSIRKASRRKVRFFSRVEVLDIRHHNSMSELEREAIWMTAAEFKTMKTQAKTTVLKMMSGEVVDEDDPDFCIRGLECKTLAGSRVRNKNKLRTRLAVLNEQNLQREEGLYDPRFIAMASMDASFGCRQEAHKRGEKDAKAVGSYLNNATRRVKRS